MIHELKIAEHWYDRIATGEKRAEIREHDRDYQVGDTLRLVPVQGRHNIRVSHWVPEGRDERGRFTAGYMEYPSMDATITHILPADHFPDGIRAGYCVLSIEVVS